MSAQIIDLTEHRRSARGGPLDHWSRRDYGSFAELLEDADRVVDDLDTGGRLFVTAGEIEFTTRRLRALLRGAMRSIPDQIAEVP